MKYPLASDTWGKEELAAIHRVVQSGRYTMGDEVKKFETEFAMQFGAKHAIMVNSGSSANLLMIGALFETGKLKKGDEVIVPAVSWSTTYFPLHQYGLKMVFVDVGDDWNMDPELVKKEITSKTRVIFAVNLLGNPSKLDELKAISQAYGLYLLEDNCESLGALVNSNNRYTGTFGLMGSFSFFFSHHIQTMEGGMILTDDDKLEQYCRAMRDHGWTRDLEDKNLIQFKTGNPFEDSFKFVVPGYCLRPLEMSGAIGQEQLKKMNGFIMGRIQNAMVFQRTIGQLPFVDIQRENNTSSWFGFGIVLKGIMEGRRDDLVNHLIASGVECRPIIAGNFMNQPVMDSFDRRMYKKTPTPMADRMDANGFFIGNDAKDLEKEIEYAHNLIVDFSLKK